MKEDHYAPAERATACELVAASAAAGGAERGGGDASGAAAEVCASWVGGHSAAAPCASAATAAASAAAPVVQVPAIVSDVSMRRALGLAAIGSASDALVPDSRQFGGSGLGSVRGVRPVESARGSGLLSGQPTGSETEPWSMMGSFEDLLNGLVTDEPEEEEEEEEEATLPGRSRFARFFSSPNTEEHMVGGGSGPGGASALASLGGIKLDAPFEPAKQQDDWQQGFRALLPNVNISFSPFGDSAGPSQADGLAPQGPVAVPKSLGVVGGMGGLRFGAFGASGVGSLGQPSAAAPVVGCATPFSSSTSGGLGGSFELPGGGLGSGFGASALNGGAGLPGLGGTSSSTGEVSILHQLSSCQLPGAQLQLSSHLQSLLQGANGSSRATGPSRAADSAHMPGWEGLLTKGDEQPKEQAGGSSARKKEGGGSERGGKGKKRGGTSNRGKSGEAKLQPPAHNGK